MTFTEHGQSHYYLYENVGITLADCGRGMVRWVFRPLLIAHTSSCSALDQIGCGKDITLTLMRGVVAAMHDVMRSTNWV